MKTEIQGKWKTDRNYWGGSEVKQGDSRVGRGEKVKGEKRKENEEQREKKRIVWRRRGGAKCLKQRRKKKF